MRSNTARPLEQARRLRQQNMSGAAMELCDGILSRNPRNFDARLLLAEMYRQRGEYGKAVGHLEICYAAQPQHLDVLLSIGYCLLQEGFSARALALADAGLALRDNSLSFLTLKAMTHEYRSEFAEALATADRLPNPSSADAATLRVASLLGLKRYDEAVACARAITDDSQRSRDDRRRLLMYLCKIYDKTRRYDEAIEACRQAHALTPREFDSTAYSRRVDEIMDCFSRENLAMIPRGSSRSALPVFVVGMPRSGTTLIEQIISSHPDAYGAGEIRDIVNIANSLTAETSSMHIFPRCVVDLTRETADRLAQRYLGHLQEIAGGASRVVNKALEQYEYLGLIAVLLPGARVIHCRRDPRDVCLSCYTRHLNDRRMPYATSLAHLGHVYREHERLMDYWKRTTEIQILTVQYEDLVASQQDISRRIVAFLDLPWDDRCLRYWESERTATTLSYDQVNQPIYDSSIGRWKNYEKHLGPLMAVLSLPADQVQARADGS